MSEEVSHPRADEGRGAVLCFLEHDEEGVLDASLRALTLARSLSSSSGRALIVAAIGEMSTSKIETLAAFAVSEVFQVSIEGLASYSPAGWSHALLDLLDILGADTLVSAGTDRGQEIVANIGATTGRPMAANCLSASWIDDQSLRLSRQRWGGSLIEDAVLEGTPALLTVASDGVLAERAETPTSITVHDFATVATDADRRVLVGEWVARGGGVSLADARVVVGGGRGVGSEEGFAALDELANLLGAAVGVSRAVTSAGWRPHAQQVGQTGTKISPELYLACGISGATQHLAGCRSAKHVVTINTDADAPFLSRADFALVGDLSVIVPALTNAIRSRA
ncbi:MAG TPA: electron transfer flavoprotein subunit alpha/FixB family protein [Acidimicrobiales bacterium]|nr:electron transfer flavoprotein subunit alpha/FixB family protein [Acidimicrobiales bacterium]